MTDRPLLTTMAWLSLAAHLMAAPVGELSATSPARSPAQQKIAWAEAAIEKDAKHYRGYNDLASAQVRRARETADLAPFIDAERAVQTSLSLVPNNFEARRIEVEIRLGRGEFAAAAKGAKALNGRVADDIPVYGLIADAAIGLGDYAGAEEAVQWMLNLRPPAPPGLLRAAQLRELFGDAEGAAELLNAAHAMIAPDEVEERALVLTRLGRLKFLDGKHDDAAALLSQALESFPNYPDSLVGLARVRSAQRRHDEALALLRRACDAAPRPASLYSMAQALERAGRADDAKAAYADFERKARSAMGGRANANRELVFHYADRANDPAEALRIARLEVDAGGRHDVQTLHAHAWALHKNGDNAGAGKQIEAALKTGVRDAEMLYHAGAIAAAADDHGTAAGFFEKSLDLEPEAPYAEAARRALRGRPATGAALDPANEALRP